jgi:hypothetical protein
LAPCLIRRCTIPLLPLHDSTPSVARRTS